MKKILSIHSWLRSFPVEKQVAVAKETGFDGIDYIATMSELLLSKDKISRFSKEYNIPVLGIHSPLPIVTITPSILFQKLFQYVSLFPECRVYNFHLSGFMSPFLNWEGNTIEKFMKLAKEKKVVISFESNPIRPVYVFSWFYPKATYDPETFADYCARNNLLITFDTSHIADQGYDIVKFYRKYYKIVKLIHLSDFKGNVQHLPLGKGDLPLKALFSEMKKTGYKETVSFEIYEFPRNTSTAAKQAAIKESLRFFNQYT